MPVEAADQAAAESAFITRVLERERAREQHLLEQRREAWADLPLGSCVRLRGSVTERVLGLGLRDEQGDEVEMDGLLINIDPERHVGSVRVLMLCDWPGRPDCGGAPVMGFTHDVGRNEILGVSDHPPSVWRDAATAGETAAMRDGRDPPSRHAHKYWED